MREWAAGHLAEHGAAAELEQAIAAAAAERHPDVLAALVDWFGRPGQEQVLDRLLDLASRWRKAGNPEAAAGLLLRQLPLFPDEPHRAAALELLAGKSLAGELLGLRRDCGGPGFLKRLRSLTVKLPGPTRRRLLAGLTPPDPRLRARWLYGVATLPDERAGEAAGEWREFFRGLAPEKDSPKAARDGDPRVWASELEAAASRVSGGLWVCPALSPRLDAALGLLVGAVAEIKAAASALADALREDEGLGAAGAPPAEGRLESDELRGLLRGVADACGGVEAARRAVAASADAPALLLAVLSIPSAIPPSGLDLLCAALADSERSESAAALERFLRGSAARGSPFAEARALALLRRAGGQGSLPVLVERLGKHAPEARSQALLEILALGPAILAALEPELEGGDPSRLELVVEAFAHFPTPRSGRALCARAARLFEALPQEAVVGALAATGCAAAGEALRDAYRSGEADLAGALALLADLHGGALASREVTRDLAQAQQAASRERRRLHSPRDPLEFLETDAGEGFSVALRCRRCRREYHYHVHYILVALDFLEESLTDACGFDGLIECKRCGAVEDYDFGESAAALLTAEMIRSDLIDKLRQRREVGEAGGLSGEGGEPAEDDGPGIASGRLRFLHALQADGRKFGCTRRILEHLRRQAEQGPRRADVFKRLGNVYKNGGLRGPARGYFEKALALDPDEMEAHLNLGLLHLEAREWEAARLRLTRVLELGRHRAFPIEQRRDFARAALRGLRELRDRAGLPLPRPERRIELEGVGSVTVVAWDLDSDAGIDSVIDSFAKP